MKPRSAEGHLRNPEAPGQTAIGQISTVNEAQRRIIDSLGLTGVTCDGPRSHLINPADQSRDAFFD